MDHSGFYIASTRVGIGDYSHSSGAFDDYAPFRESFRNEQESITSELTKNRDATMPISRGPALIMRH